MHKRPPVPCMGTGGLKYWFPVQYYKNMKKPEHRCANATLTFLPYSCQMTSGCHAVTLHASHVIAESLKITFFNMAISTSLTNPAIHISEPLCMTVKIEFKLNALN